MVHSIKNGRPCMKRDDRKEMPLTVGQKNLYCKIWALRPVQ